MIEKGVATVDLSAGNATVDDLDGSGIELDRLELSIGTMEQWQALTELRRAGWTPVGETWELRHAVTRAFRVNVVRNPSAALGVVEEPADELPDDSLQTAAGLRARIAELRFTIKELETDRDALAVKLERRREQIAELQGDTDLRFAARTAELKSVRARRDDLRAERDAARELSQERLELLTQAQARIDELETDVAKWKGSYDNVLKDWSALVDQVATRNEERDQARKERAEYLAELRKVYEGLRNVPNHPATRLSHLPTE